jgi:very-short-patch-repair endonuclease
MGEEKTPTWRVSSKLRSNARALRKNSTDAERILWSELRDHRLNGASFRRQVPIENYIADFVCHPAKLVIELDGGQHFSLDGEAADARRSAVIEALGFRVLRFSNHDVTTNRAGVLETIATEIAERARIPALPRKRRAIAYDLRELLAAESDGERSGIGSRTFPSFSFGFSEFLAICDCPTRKRERGPTARAGSRVPKPSDESNQP